MHSSETHLSMIQALGLKPERMPRHVAIIMDGNGRWARQRGWLRMRGHRRGADVVRMVTTESARLGIDYLTLYCFSSENWCRPQAEVTYLMKLLDDFLRSELATLQENNVRLQAIGRIQHLPAATQKTLSDCIAATQHNSGMVLYLALSYGGREEIVDACRSIAAQVKHAGLEPEQIDEACIEKHLYTAGASDVDVLIRTGGEQRMSNFLPWQSTYAEFISVASFWPEFTQQQYHESLRTFQSRNRRFGDTGERAEHSEGASDLL